MLNFNYDAYGRTPLSWAAEYGHEAVAKLLLATEVVEPDSKDEYGRTPLSWAAGNGHKAVVKILLAAKSVDPDSEDKYGRTPLSRAARSGHKAVVKILLAVKLVNPDSKDKYGQTPLSRAAENGYEAVVKILLAAKSVDSGSKDNDGQTPLSWAARNGHKAVVKLLQSRAPSRLQVRQGESTSELRSVRLFRYVFQCSWLVSEVFKSLQFLPKELELGDTLVLLDHGNDRFEATSCRSYFESWGEIGDLILRIIVSLCRKADCKIEGKENYTIPRVCEINACVSEGDVRCEVLAAETETVVRAVTCLAMATSALRPACSGLELVQLNGLKSAIESRIEKNEPEACNERFSDTGYQDTTPDLSEFIKISEFENSGPSYCWKSMLDGGIIVYDPTPPYSSVPPGLKVTFDLLVQLSAVTTLTYYNNGVVLIGFQTALVPLCAVQGQAQDIVRWHFITTPKQQITIYDIEEATKNVNRLLSTDFEYLKCRIAVVGWSADAHMLLGSADLPLDQICRSNLKTCESMSARAEITKEVSLQLSAPVVAFSTKLGDVRVLMPIRASYDPESDYGLALDQAKDLCHIIYDNLTGQFWLVPDINLLLCCVRLYLYKKGYEGDFPSFSTSSNVSTCPTGIPPQTATLRQVATSAAKALALNPVLKNKETGYSLTCRELTLKLWRRISEANNLICNRTTKMPLKKHLAGLRDRTL